MNKKYYPFFVPLLIILIWLLFSYFEIFSPIFIPSPQEIKTQLVEYVHDGDLIKDIYSTFYRLFFSFVIAIIIGTPIGLLMGYSEKTFRLLNSTIDFFRSIPVTALFPLFLLFFGIGDEAKISAAAWSAMLIIMINTMHGVQHVKIIRLKVAETMRLTKTQVMTKVIFHESLSQIITGYRTALSISLVIVVVTEMFIGTKYGLGHRIINAQLTYRISDMYLSILTTGILGYILNKILLLFEKRIIHWKGK
jgi:NitT/TauT family transport system permease protein